MPTKPLAQIVDCYKGNLGKLERALVRVGFTVRVAGLDFGGADIVILPGMGSLGSLSEAEYAAVGSFLVNNTSIPVLGICAGMQLMYAGSKENNGYVNSVSPVNRVLDYLEYTNTGQKSNIGWRGIKKLTGGSCEHWEAKSFWDKEFINYLDDTTVFFSHSFCDYEILSAECVMTSETEQGSIVAAIIVENNFGVQFHPELSGFIGLEFFDLIRTKLCA